MELYLRSRRRRGELLIDAPKNPGGQAEHESYQLQNEASRPKTLKELGLTTVDATKDYKLLEIPDEQWEGVSPQVQGIRLR